MSQMQLSQKVKDLLSLKKQMLGLKVCTIEVQNKINEEFAILLDNVENKIRELNDEKKEILSYIIDPDDMEKVKVIQKDKEPEEVKEIDSKRVEIKLTQETAHKVNIIEPYVGTVVNAGETITLKFKGKQKVGQDAFVFEWYGTSQKGWISNHVLYTGTTYLDRKYGKLYIVTKDGITSAKMSILEKYLVDFGKEVLIGDGMSIVNPNYLKIKAGFDINFI